MRLAYDAIHGLNPFTDFIYGNWYQPAKGVRNPRTALFRGNGQMRFREKLGDFKAWPARPEYLVNVAGMTVGGKVVAAGISLGKHGDEFDNYSDNSQRYTEAIERAIRHGVDKVGHHTVRRCRIRSCDQAGICGSLGAMFSTIENCDIGYCHWNANFNGCENKQAKGCHDG